MTTQLSAAQVMALRKKTGLPMMECKQALAEARGDEAAAIEWLKKKHKGKMESRGDRETGEGRIGVYIDSARKTGAIIELRCESAPVGKNDLFINLANNLARHVAQGSEKSPDPQGVHKALESEITEVYGQLRETMNVGTCRKLTGEVLESYVHHDGKSGVLVAMSGKPTDAELGKNLAMHIAFHKPVAIDRDGVSADQIERVRAEALAAARDEGKPEGVINKIADGKVNAFFAECVLLEQEHARNDVYGRKKVKDVLAEHGVTGVTDMVYLAVGGS
jgi:elongation factor Ts